MSHNVFNVGHTESDVYYNKENKNYMVPSVAYLDACIKKIEDALGLSLPSIDDRQVELTLISNKDDLIPADRVKTDLNHNFVSLALLETFKDKVSSQELNIALTDLTNKFRMEINNQFNRILNTPNALQGLRNIASILAENDSLNAIFEDISSKVEEDDFDEHLKSNVHLNNNDRKAINLILNMIANGGLDWNAEEGTFGYIKNKPTSMPANGGDAATVGGIDPLDLKPKKVYNVIYASHNRPATPVYNKEDVDVLVTPINIKGVEVSLGILSPGEYLFRPGVYTWDKLNIGGTKVVEGESILRGQGSSTIFSSGVHEIIVSSNATLKDMAFVNCKVIVKGDSITLDNVKFTNCILTVDTTRDLTIRNCKFDTCSIKLTGNNTGMMITGNKFCRTESKFYRGATNYVDGNLSY